MDLLTLFLFVVGLVLLVVGAEALVRGSSRLAAMLGLSPLLIGLTIVAFGTSSPELAVSVSASLSGQPDLAFGNVVGSNIFNVLFILGISALITPLVVQRQLVRIDVPIMIGVSLLLYLLSMDGDLSRFDGIVLFLLFAAYTFLSIKLGSADPAMKDPDAPPVKGHWSLHVVFVVVGLALLVLGSQWMVNGAMAIARSLGVSELVIGLTIVAAGTSMPEVATSIIASLRGEKDIAVGNVVGSNIFNILAVLGLSAIVAPGGLPIPPGALHFDTPVMIAVAVACLPIFFTGHVIARWEGALFLAYYVAFTVYLILNATGHDLLAPFSAAMGGYVLPLTGITLLLVGWREWNKKTRTVEP